jgi:hypothetical protein
MQSPLGTLPIVEPDCPIILRDLLFVPELPSW